MMPQRRVRGNQRLQQRHHLSAVLPHNRLQGVKGALTPRPGHVQRCCAKVLRAEHGQHVCVPLPPALAPSAHRFLQPAYSLAEHAGTDAPSLLCQHAQH
ncbi:hypothetical protein FKM82_030132 [Ascaphus truei]